MINKKKSDYLKLAVQHNLKYIKIKPHTTKKLLTKNYSLYIFKKKLTLNKHILYRLLNA